MTDVTPGGGVSPEGTAGESNNGDNQPGGGSPAWGTPPPPAPPGAFPPPPPAPPGPPPGSGAFPPPPPPAQPPYGPPQGQPPRFPPQYQQPYGAGSQQWPLAAGPTDALGRPAKVVVSGLIGLILMAAGIYGIVHSLSGGSSPPSSVIAGYNGTGTLRAGPVTVPGSWQIAWSYSCPNSVSTPDFVVARVYDAASVPASESVILAARPPLLIKHGVSGSGTQPYTGAGNVTFVVATSTDCSWKLTVSG